MSKLASLIRQTEIIKLAKRKSFDWETLDQHLARKEEELGHQLCISKRTFNRDLSEIASLFGIAISFDFKTALYSIVPEDSSEENTQLLEAFDMLQVFGQKGKVPSYLLFEERKAKGTEHLTSILAAIQKQKLVNIQYEKYWMWELEDRTLKPLALKEFKQRWYLLSLDENNKFKVFGLDRIRNLEILQEGYQVSQHMDFEQYFKNVFGIINSPGNPVEEVILTFTEFKGRYIKSLPLHASQEILVDDGSMLTIRLQVKIEYELIAEILSHGDEVRVEEPERLRDLVRKKAGNVVKGILVT
ncbi:Predicted DNA-binding transcriptional regulator YafY, contains an HTH and WYL domains [Aquiflexum balticum DSM 16537]|uniref:Predicted DNA-binding transcriptional regulator YafY, contains an HTH and WYL domains n=1 Tax=Aquiflexum balticum DSM 16537 TaxID=758820 RepID=A0A1W2HB60_9BACT|nr:WYL domain-containing protein [Aquiflexum balticum]SMD45826.1 Predicted DNA-binding transcriptional regulator YafY, contains an HTH and WYL domains [Aquiflexum balticum DSM 16537]